MGFEWKKAVKGGINGFRAGSRSGNPWVMLGTTAAGAVGGGYGKDIDKKLTGNSQSGFTEGLIEKAGDMGSYGKGGQAAGIGGNLFDRFSGDDKVEEGYENNPAVLARQKNKEAEGSGSISMGGGMMDGMSIPGMSGGQGGFDLGSLTNLFGRGGSSNSGQMGVAQGEWDWMKPKSSQNQNQNGGMDLNSIMQLIETIQAFRGNSGSSSGSGFMNMFSRN